MQWNQAVKQLKAFSQTETIRESVVTFSSTVINGLLGIIYYFYLAKILTPDAFGQSTIFISAVVLGFSIFNFGLDQSIVRYKSDSKILANVFGLKIILGVFVSLTCFILLGTHNIFGLVGLGIASQLLFSLAITFLQSWQNYLSWALLYVSTNLLRLMVALWVKSPYPVFHILNYIIVPSIGFCFFVLIYKARLPKPYFNIKEFQKILSFNIPLSLNSIFSTVSSKIDAFFIASFQSFAQAGVYNLANQIAIFPHLVTAFSAVTAPKFKNMGNLQNNFHYLKKTTIFTSIVAALLIPVLLLAAYVLFSFSGLNMISNIPILIPLFLGYGVFFASVPLRDSLLYYFGDSKIFLHLSILNLLLSVLNGFLFIRPYGPIAAAGLFLIVQIISLIILMLKYAKNSRSYHR